MIGFENKKFGGFALGYSSEAEVTICRVGVRGWHIHTTYRKADVGNDIAGLCGDESTEDAARELFARAVENAEKWWDSNEANK